MRTTFGGVDAGGDVIGVSAHNAVPLVPLSVLMHIWTGLSVTVTWARADRFDHHGCGNGGRTFEESHFAQISKTVEASILIAAHDEDIGLLLPYVFLLQLERLVKEY